MAWDKNKPAGSQKLRLADDDIRANNAALEAAFGEGHDFVTGGAQTGKHVAPTFKDVVTDPPAPTGTNDLRLYNKAGQLITVSQAGIRRNVRDADTLNGLESGNGSGQIPVSNGTTCTNLRAQYAYWSDLATNSDKLDGYHAQDLLDIFLGQVPVPSSDAATLGGYPPGNAANNIPISNGTRCVNLNADLLDGYHLSGVIGLMIPANTKMIFKQNYAPSGWTFLAEDNDRVLINTSTLSGGGVQGGSWTISGFSVSGTSLSVAQLPYVSGYFEIKKMQGGDIVNTTSGVFSKTAVTAGVYPRASDEGGSVDVDRITMSFGSGQAHAHTVSNDGSWRPLAVAVITCKKNSYPAV